MEGEKAEEEAPEGPPASLRGVLLRRRRRRRVPCAATRAGGRLLPTTTLGTACPTCVSCTAAPVSRRCSSRPRRRLRLRLRRCLQRGSLFLSLPREGVCCCAARAAGVGVPGRRGYGQGRFRKQRHVLGEISLATHKAYSYFKD